MEWLSSLDLGVMATIAGAVIVAFFTWRTHMLVARRRLTYESIQKKYWDVDYIIARRMFNDYRMRLKNLEKLDEFFNPPKINGESNSEGEVSDKKDSDIKDNDKEVCRAESGKIRNNVVDFRMSVFSRPREYVQTILNDYELLSIGIANGVVDENMAKTLLYSTVMNDYTTCRRFIQHLRDRGNNPRTYIEFEKLCIRWVNNPPNPKKTFGKFKKLWW